MTQPERVATLFKLLNKPFPVKANWNFNCFLFWAGVLSNDVMCWVYT